MKAFVGLTILQALLVAGIPHLRRQPQSSSSLPVLEKADLNAPVSSPPFSSPIPQEKNVVARYLKIVTIYKSRTTTICPELMHHVPSGDPTEPKFFAPVDKFSEGVLLVSSSASEITTLDPTTTMATSGSLASSSTITSSFTFLGSGDTITPSTIPGIDSPATLVNAVSPQPTTTSGETDSPLSTSSVIPSVSISATSTIVSLLPTASQGIFFQISTSSVIPRVSISTASAISGVIQILPTLSTQTPSTSETVVSSTLSSGVLISGPLITASISPPSTTISLTGPVSSPTTSVVVGMPSDNIFEPVATDAPPSILGARSDHPVPRLGIQPQNSPIETNKFYANFFLGSQTAPSWTHPYLVAWSKGGGLSGSWGLSVSQVDAIQKVFGPDPTANPVEYFTNPNDIQSLVLSALELGASTTISLDTLTAFSANVNLLPNSGAQPAITFPLVQGMAFVTGIYTGGTPILQTGVLFTSITKAMTSPKTGITKYTILLNDGQTWFLYAYSLDGAGLDFTVVSNGLAQATSNFNGIIQIAKNPGGVAEALYDVGCGVYPTTAVLSGNVNGATGSYTLSFTKAGMVNTTLSTFALPHHVASFDYNTQSALTTVQLDTTTKGIATMVVADSWTLIEQLPTTLGFAPWAPSNNNGSVVLSAATIAAISTVAASEVSQNMGEQTNLNSMYYSGKALAKFAGIVYTLHDIVQNVALAQAGLANLQAAFAVFASNTQQYPLVYESAWGGIVSTASYTTGDSGADFGNTYYNDHHFHYGYFIYTAAVIGYLDPSWLAANEDYVSALVRDIANPSTEDNFFPVSRMFDWYHGHSWAHGLYETFDGKDEESSSEDSMSAYAIKMWGHTIGDANVEARGNLQLAVTARSLQSYFLYTSSNTIQPANFIGNKVSGILFENKIDHTTYFGSNPEYIEGIHMLPLLPHSTLTRTQQFVEEEWNTYFSNGRADAVVGGWKGVLYANLAIVDPVTAWQFFSQAGFDVTWLDGGASRTWYMAFAAGLGGAS